MDALGKVADDAAVVRLVPLYRAAKELRVGIMETGGVYHYAGALEAQIERAILTDGFVVKVQTEVALNNLIIHARMVLAGAEALKALVEALD